jgi:hypothetical protein
MKELRFVNELVPGQRRNRREASNIRSHVRRAVMENRRRTDIDHRLRMYAVGSDEQSDKEDMRKMRNVPQVQPQLTVLHPYTTAATALLSLPVSRIDSLFKGREFDFSQRAS